MVRTTNCGFRAPNRGQRVKRKGLQMKRMIAISIAALAVFGAVYAFAAGLGGITTNEVGAENTTVSGCDTNGVSVAYTTGWDATDKRYEISSVTVSGVADTCDGDTLRESVTDSTGNQLGTGSLTIPTDASTSHAVSLSTAASAKDTVGVHVVVS
jgi:hypothetical protein